MGKKVRVYFGGNYEFYEANVHTYDDEEKKHLLYYLADGEQVSEDLTTQKWQVSLSLKLSCSV